MKKKKLPIGIDDFKTLIEENYYFVDKTKFIEEILNEDSSVTLITRPRRFGKTLNMSMLRYFLDIKTDFKYLFRGLEISNINDKDILDMQNSTPVIHLNFKDCKGNTKEVLIDRIYKVLVAECRKIFTYKEMDDYDLNSVLGKNIMNLNDGILRITECLSKKYNKKVVLLIDEYDTPILSSYEYGYYKELKSFFAVFYGSSLKSNEYLKQALLTGINRVAKNNIFSGLNNLSVFTVKSKNFSDKFGLMESEVKTMLSNYDMKYSDEIKDFYDGYKFGQSEIFNPWSILNYVKHKELVPYWVNTGSNMLLKDKTLELGESSLTIINDVLVQDTVYCYYDVNSMVFEETNIKTFVGLLINAGYLTIHKEDTYESGYVKIPNKELKTELTKLLDFCVLGTGTNIIHKMKLALLKEDFIMFGKVLEKILMNNFSYHDMKEYAYHVFMNTLMLHMTDIYELHSNLEMGIGRSDIYLKPRTKDLKPIIFELKKSKCISELEKDAQEGLRQIDNKKYDYSIDDCFKIGLAFCGKEMCIKMISDLHLRKF